MTSFVSIKIDSAFVYFEIAQRNFSGYFRVPRSGGKPEPLRAGGWQFDVQAQQLFWSSPFGNAPGCVRRTAADGSGAVSIDSGLFDYQSPRVDDKAVYVIRDIDIVRIAR